MKREKIKCSPKVRLHLLDFLFQITEKIIGEKFLNRNIKAIT